MLGSAEQVRASQPHDAPWAADPTLLPLLQIIVADAARVGRGARLVLKYPGTGRLVLVSPSGLRYPWRALTASVIENAETVLRPGVVAAPVLPRHGVSGALVIYHESSAELPRGDTLACAFAARVETELAASTERLTSIAGTVDGLTRMLAVYDPDTARHSMVVRRLASIIGRAARLSPRELLELEWAATLHDIGKVAVTLPILHKVGPLTATEWALMRQHPTIGEKIARSAPGLAAVALAIRHHHERWDGTGYPDRLSSDAIPLTSRLVGIVDAYETMRAGRPYRGALSRDEAVQELTCAAGRQFDPALLDLLPALVKHDIAL